MGWGNKKENRALHGSLFVVRAGRGSGHADDHGSADHSSNGQNDDGSEAKIGGRRRRGRINRSARRNVNGFVSGRIGHADLNGCLGSVGDEGSRQIISLILKRDIDLLGKVFVIGNPNLQFVAVLRVVCNLERNRQNELAVGSACAGRTEAAARAFPSVLAGSGLRSGGSELEEGIQFVSGFRGNGNQIVAEVHEHGEQTQLHIVGQTFQRDGNIDLITGLAFGNHNVPAEIGFDNRIVRGNGNGEGCVCIRVPSGIRRLGTIDFAGFLIKHSDCATVQASG